VILIQQVYLNTFIFGFSILLLVLSRLLEVRPLAITFQDVYLYIFANATCFGPVGHLQVNIQLNAESYCSYSGSVVLCALVLLRSICNIFGKFCRCQLNVRVCCLKVDKNISLLNIIILKC
jgi:hypothetical protein